MTGVTSYYDPDHRTISGILSLDATLPLVYAEGKPREVCPIWITGSRDPGGLVLAVEGSNRPHKRSGRVTWGFFTPGPLCRISVQGKPGLEFNSVLDPGPRPRPLGRLLLLEKKHRGACITHPVLSCCRALSS